MDHHNNSPDTGQASAATAGQAAASASLSDHHKESNNNNMSSMSSSNNNSMSSLTSSNNESLPSSSLLVPTLFGKRVNLPAMHASTMSSSNHSMAQQSQQEPLAAATASAAAINSTCNTLKIHNNNNNNNKKRPRSGLSFPDDWSTSSSLDAGLAAFSSSGPQVPVSEDEGDRDKRRQDRNMREQQRSHQINHQIDELRDILLQANLQFKPDKYSTLATVASYISDLQHQKSGLEEEHEKLLNTIRSTAQIVTQQFVAPAPPPPPPSSQHEGDDYNGTGPTVVPPTKKKKHYAAPTSSSTISGIDYKAIFAQHVPVFGTSVTSIDGRFLDCSQGFEHVSGFERCELLPLEQPPPSNGTNGNPQQAQQQHVGEDGIERNLSLFNVLDRTDMERVFHTMSQMLRRPVSSTELDDEMWKQDTYTTMVTLCRRSGGPPVQLSLSLVRTDDRRPRLFNCTLIPQGDNSALHTTG